jgi:hypothetical protein
MRYHITTGPCVCKLQVVLSAMHICIDLPVRKQASVGRFAWAQAFGVCSIRLRESLRMACVTARHCSPATSRPRELHERVHRESSMSPQSLFACKCAVQLPCRGVRTFRVWTFVTLLAHNLRAWCALAPYIALPAFNDCRLLMKSVSQRHLFLLVSPAGSTPCRAQELPRR